MTNQIVSDAETPAETPAELAAEVKALRGALLRYRIFAYIVGVLLVVLICVAVPLKYFGNNSALVTWTGIPHGWLYMGLLITAYDLIRRLHWPLSKLLLIAVSGLVPFLTFVTEHSVTKQAKAQIADLDASLSR